jgi:SAM-dependent methyltransferase
MGSLRRLSPLAPVARGVPLDAYYVEEFLTQNRHVISGRVLATGDLGYVRRFGGSRVTMTDVLPIEQDSDYGPSLTGLGDGPRQPVDTYDCIVLVGGIERVHDLPAVVRALNRLLRPGGTLLATFQGIGPVAATGPAPTMWSLTPASASRLFGEVFGTDFVEVAGYGNVLTATAFLHGLGSGDLRPRELRVRDPRFPLLVSVRAGRPTDNGFSGRSGQDEP